MKAFYRSATMTIGYGAAGLAGCHKPVKQRRTTSKSAFSKAWHAIFSRNED